MAWQDDEPPEYEFDCGMMDGGYCTKAGSEECDFECPLMRRRRYP